MFSTTKSMNEPNLLSDPPPKVRLGHQESCQRTAVANRAEENCAGLEEDVAVLVQVMNELKAEATEQHSSDVTHTTGHGN